ncbi:MAG: tRNA (adenosine(37)-N6)-threonylcarbamoyltransferase complex dimerization subunit type 1 TsaB [Ferruginibacter sp.]
MGLILNIDTATETAYVNIADKGVIIQERKSIEQKDHASFLQPAIKELTAALDISLKDLDAIAVCAGPGSYTGLRVGMASAKGLCYALHKPLIAVNSLEILANAAQAAINEENKKESLICPMIDARRMEVFTALYDASMNVVMEPCAMILEPESFSQQIQQIFFIGSGITKWEKICPSKTSNLIKKYNTGASMALLAGKSFIKGQFAHLTNIVPMYIKDFHVVTK